MSTTSAPAPRTHAVGDTVVLLRRSLKHVTRSVDTIVTTAVMPIAFLLLFVYVFGGAIDTGSGVGSDDYVDYLLPGILLMTVATGVSYTAFRLYLDMSAGIVARFRSMPIARPAVLWSHVLTSVVANVVSLAVVVLVALLIGFRTSAGPLDLLAAGGVLLLFTLALTWVAIIPGLTASSPDGATGFCYPLVFLPFLSSAFVPTDSMPGPVRVFAEHQPVSSVVDSLRGLFAGTPDGGDLLGALAWCVGLLVVAYLLALRTYARRLGRAG